MDSGIFISLTSEAGFRFPFSSRKSIMFLEMVAKSFVLVYFLCSSSVGRLRLSPMRSMS